MQQVTDMNGLSMADRLYAHPSTEMEWPTLGELIDLDTEKLVPGFRISAAKLRLSGDQTQVAIDGDGLFGEVPIQATWRQLIGGKTAQRSTLSGQIELSPRLMDELKAGLPSGMLTGQGVAEISLGIGGGEQ